MHRGGWRVAVGVLGALACKPAPANAPQGRRTGVALQVPSRPEDLLHAGAIERVQDALAQQGLGGKFARGELDAATTASLRKLQEQHDLAQTGLPDRATLAALGLDPDDVYRARPIPEQQESQRPAALREELNGGQQDTGGSGEH
jgi:hypothetical protein